MKKVLIIAYYFPPSGGAGVQRVMKFVKYLPEFGWEPLVLTVNENAGFPVRDSSLLNEIPKDIRVIRTRIFEPYRAFHRFTGKSSAQGTDMATLHRRRRSLRERIAEFVRSNFFIPDARCFWRSTAVPAGKKLLKNERIDLIFSSAPPYTTHLVARAIADYADLPWIADFRDSWVDWLSAPKRTGISRRIDLAMENSVLKRADHITHVTRGIQQDLLSRHPDVSKEKWSLIPNGFDREDFNGLTPETAGTHFVITYTGSLYGHRNPESFLEGLRLLFQNQPQYRQKIRVQFIGRVDPEFIRAFGAFGDHIVHIPYVTHRESLEYMLKSDVLLLIIDDARASRSIITGKCYEYLASGRPILAIAPEGEAADLIRTLKAGEVVSPQHPVAVHHTLLRMIGKWQAGEDIPVDADMINRYDRKVITGHLAGLFHKVLSGTVLQQENE
ncbi:glycosyltransferase family 4 protein [bacterium]|nr:glycosyltransferase family 4 protein [bacterium]